MFPRLQKTRMLKPSPSERWARGERAIPFFLAVFGLGSLGRELTSYVSSLLLPHADSATRLLISLFGTVTMIVAVLLWGLLVERRSARGLGLCPRGSVADYAVGAVGGVLLFGGAVGICSLFGIAEVRIASAAPSWWLLLLFLVAFLIQGLSEELLCRSLLMISLSRAWPLWACAVFNSAAFSALHLFNPGISLLALLNIFLFGLLASVLMLKRGSVWMVASLHSLWNFAQGNLFGLPVSGLYGSPAPLSTTVSGETAWGRLVGGGAFGIEGGLAATAVLLAGLLIVLLLPTKKSEIEE